MISLNVPFLPNSTIVSKAEDFLVRQNLTSIPIDIEIVAEGALDLSIIPFSELKREYGIDGYSAHDCSTIYVDKYIFQQRPNRLRYTVAHELGHIILHKKYMQQVNWSSVQEWMNTLENLDSKDISSMEYQAYVFAGLVLVPQKFLKTPFVNQLPNLESQINSARNKGFVRADYIGPVIFQIADSLSRQFQVSNEVMIRRIKFDGLDELIE